MMNLSKKFMNGDFQAHRSYKWNDVGNSTQIVTDLNSAATATLSATATAAAIAAAGPIMDLKGCLTKLVLNAQEMQYLMNYILGGQATAPASLTAPTGGVITSGADSATYNLLVGVFQILK